jgi:NAD(P)-dependent dehydrogenase (short-subunit alcohol dehydrogenase family)
MTGLLAGKRILITGAGAGLGRAIALACGAQGAHVVVTSLGDNGRAVRDEITTAAGAAVVRRCDVTDRAEVAAAVSSAVERGGLDGAVHNAISRGSAAGTGLEDWDPERWEAEVSVALRGAYFVAAAAAGPGARARWCC